MGRHANASRTFLAAGIGLAAALASIVDAILLRPLPVAPQWEVARVFTSSAVYADGSTAGTPDEVQLIARRKAMRATVNDLITKLEKAKSAGTSASELAAELKSQADRMQGLTKSTHNSQQAIDQSATKMLTTGTAASLGSHSIDQAIAVLKGIEGRFASSKPAL